MPQPLSRVAPNAGFDLGNSGQRMLSQHEPQLALMAMEVIASWSNVEAFLLNLYISLMGDTSELAATVYLALDTQSAKTKAIQAIARSVLDEKHLALLNAILATAKTHQKTRDKIAHHKWGRSPQLPGALLLADPKASLGTIVSRDLLHPGADLKAYSKKLNDYHDRVFEDLDRMKDHLYVYREIDFQNAIAANDRICGYAATMQFIIVGHGADQEGELYDKLCAEPEIREKLGHRASQDRPPQQE